MARRNRQAAAKKQPRFFVGVQLTGFSKEMFRRYSDDQFIQARSEAARKLIMERLQQIYPDEFKATLKKAA